MNGEQAAARANPSPGPGVEQLPDIATLSGETPYRVELPGFEGPLDLLLHLVEKHKLDILELPIGFITERYLEYLDTLRDMNIDVASEYLVMAATLAHIKSRMLLPKEETAGEQEEQEQGDPRAELIRRLLIYQKYKQAAEELAERPLLGRDTFVRPPVNRKEWVEDDEIPLADVDVMKLVELLASVLENVKSTAVQEIFVERVSLNERIHELREILRGRPYVSFMGIMRNLQTRTDVIVTFLAILEMAKLRQIRIRQVDDEQDIHLISTSKGDEPEVFEVNEEEYR
ncbi:MAG: Segregation and condensation protein A [Myxococcota bacterium]|nr:Segregation and condensation protein A [Myxococcota bacterium]